MSDYSVKMNQMFKEGDDIRDAGLKTPKNVRRFDDILYGRNKTWQKLDLYLPKKEETSYPVIISIHGGGWVYGDKERYQYYCMSLVKHGFAVVNFTYRLAPMYKLPAPLEDTNLVVKWVLKNAETYHLDTENVFFVGDSAGGQLLASYANFCTNPDYAKLFSFKAPSKFRPRAVGLNCGVYDIKEMWKGGTNVILKEDYLKDHGSKEEMAQLEILKNVTKDFPPAFVLSSAQDFLKTDAPKIATVLSEHNVPVCMRIYADSTTDLNHVFHCDMRLAQAAKANKDECDFFKENMK